MSFRRSACAFWLDTPLRRWTGTFRSAFLTLRSNRTQTAKLNFPIPNEFVLRATKVDGKRKRRQQANRMVSFLYNDRFLRSISILSVKTDGGMPISSIVLLNFIWSMSESLLCRPFRHRSGFRAPNWFFLRLKRGRPMRGLIPKDSFCPE